MNDSYVIDKNNVVFEDVFYYAEEIVNGKCCEGCEFINNCSRSGFHWFLRHRSIECIRVVGDGYNTGHIRWKKCEEKSKVVDSRTEFAKMVCDTILG